MAGEGSFPLLGSAGSAMRRGATRSLTFAALRGAAWLGGLLALYAFAPINDVTAPWVAFVAGLGILLLGVVFIRQLVRVSSSPHPLLAAVEALMLVFGLFLCLGAFVYVAMSRGDPAAFSEPLDKVAGLYFAVTILATVGFGDIAATSDAARMVVTGQMVLNMLLVGTAVKLLTASARRGAEERLRGDVARAASSPPRGEGPSAGTADPGRSGDQQAQGGPHARG